MAVTAPIFTRSQLLNGITQRPSVPNFSKIGQEIWKARVKFIYGLSKVWLLVSRFYRTSRYLESYVKELMYSVL